MTDVLCMRLFGPMAAWGTSEAGNVRRPSQRHPPQGAILGMVAAALGIVQNDHERLAALGGCLAMAVSSHGRRRVTEEFRTAQIGFSGRGSDRMTRRERLALEAKTTLSLRQNVEDGLWRVFLAVRAPGVELPAIAAALRRPVFGLYLGRREHPLALPPDPRIVDGGLQAAVAAYPAVPTTLQGERSQLHALYDAAQRMLVSNHGFELRWDAGFPGAPAHPDAIVRVADDPFNRDAWTFREREEMSLRVAPSQAPAEPGKAAPTVLPATGDELRFFGMGDE
jgi:CRISPR system Cascade subunit CasD